MKIRFLFQSTKKEATNIQIIKRINRLKNSLLLAHSIEIEKQKGHSNYASIAQTMGLSRARISQIQHLIYLAPTIQEEILTKDLNLTEREVRNICKEPIWAKQIELWKALPQPSNP